MGNPHSTTAAEATDSVSYHPQGRNVADITRRLFRLRGLTLRPRPTRRDLPELTDAWFDETIREVDAASARLHDARLLDARLSDARHGHHGSTVAA